MSARGSFPSRIWCETNLTYNQLMKKLNFCVIVATLTFQNRGWENHKKRNGLMPREEDVWRKVFVYFDLFGGIFFGLCVQAASFWWSLKVLLLPLDFEALLWRGRQHLPELLLSSMRWNGEKKKYFRKSKLLSWAVKNKETREIGKCPKLCVHDSIKGV